MTPIGIINRGKTRSYITIHKITTATGPKNSKYGRLLGPITLSARREMQRRNAPANQAIPENITQRNAGLNLDWCLSFICGTGHSFLFHGPNVPLTILHDTTRC